MAERTINYRITATDEASAVFSRARESLNRFSENAKRETAKVSGTLGPSLLIRQNKTAGRSLEEQAIRDQMANRLRIIRYSAQKESDFYHSERIKRLADERLFGKQIVDVDNRTQQQRKQQSRQQSRNDGSSVGGPFRLNEMGESLERGMKAAMKVGIVVEGLNVGMKGLAAGAAIFANGLEGSRSEVIGFFRAFNDIPIIGRGFNVLTEAASGFGDLIGVEIDSFNELEQKIAAAAQALKDYLNLRGQQFDNEMRGQRENELAGLVGPDKERKQADFERDDKLREINKQQMELQRQAEAGVRIDPDAWASLGKQAEQAYQSHQMKLAEIDMESAEKRKKYMEDRAEEWQKVEKESKEHHFRIADFEGEHGRKIDSIRSDARATALRSQKKDLDAQIEQIEASARGEIEAIGDEFAKLFREPQLQADTALSKKFLEMQAEQQIAVAERAQQEIAAARKEDSKKQIDEALDNESKINKLRIDRLQDETRLGKAGAALEAEKLQIAQEYADKRREILEILRDEKLTESQRAEVMAELNAVDSRESAAMSRVGERIFRPQLATAATGINLATELPIQRMNLEQQQLRKQDDLLKVGRDSHTVLNRILETVQRNPGGLSSFQ